MRFLTADLPGSGGRLHADPNDFVVEEIPAYLPSGTGEHLMVEVEKVGLTTPEVIRRLAEATGAPGRQIGAAGFKDRAARARQWLSIAWPIKDPPPDLSHLAGPELKVLRVERHHNKLRRGHQRGNRFAITVRGVPPGGIERAARILEVLIERGVPNAFGPQRFGNDGDNAERALAILTGRQAPPRDRRIRDLLISALQSQVFNRVLELRLEAGSFARALEGDVMQKHPAGALFDCTDPVADQPRVEAKEISPTGVLPGPRAKATHGEPKQIEDRAIAECGLDPDLIERLDAGTRRSLRVVLDSETKVVPLDPDAYRLEVTLPSGAFATVLLAELIKPQSGEVQRFVEVD